MFLDLSQKKFVYKPKTLQILCILCSTSMTHTATIPQGIPAPFCALCFEDQCPQCPRTDLSKRFLPKQMTTTG